MTSGTHPDQPPDPSTADRIAALQERRRARVEQGEDTLAPAPRYRGVPDVALWRNPTLWLGVAALTGWTVGWLGYLTGTVPAWAAVLANSVANYLGFTVFHESVHRAAHAQRRFNDALGWIPAAMLGFTYPIFRVCHLNHHAHTNDPQRDPDHWVSHRPRVLLPIWLVTTLGSYRVLCHRNQWGTAAQRAGQITLDAAIFSAIAITAATGNLETMLVLYLLPLVTAGLFLLYAFDFLPHFPFDSTERFHDTRIQPGRVRHALLLGQNYHLIHHLWVSVPWWYYRQVFEDLEPELRSRNIRID